MRVFSAASQKVVPLSPLTKRRPRAVSSQPTRGVVEEVNAFAVGCEVGIVSKPNKTGSTAGQFAGDALAVPGKVASHHGQGQVQHDPSGAGTGKPQLSRALQVLAPLGQGHP